MGMISMLLIATAAGLSHGPSAHCLEAERVSHGVVFCSRGNVTFSLVGRTTGGKYSIYDYRYRFLPHPGGVMHGGQRLIVFEGTRYIGNYALLPKVSVTVRGAQVVLKGDEDSEAVRIDFSRGPPRQILVNGQLGTFDR